MTGRESSVKKCQLNLAFLAREPVRGGEPRAPAYPPFALEKPHESGVLNF